MNRSRMEGVGGGENSPEEHDFENALKRVEHAIETRKGKKLTEVQRKQLELAKKSILALHVDRGLNATAAAIHVVLTGLFGGATLAAASGPGTQPIALPLGTATIAAGGLVGHFYSNMLAIERELNNR